MSRGFMIRTILEEYRCNDFTSKPWYVAPEKLGKLDWCALRTIVDYLGF